VAKVVYKPIDRSTVSEPWFELLTRARRRGWAGSVNGTRGGSRTYAMQLALWTLWRAGRGAAAFHPSGPSRHMRRNIDKLGAWAQAVDVKYPEQLVSVGRKLGVELQRPYPKEPWHVEARRAFVLPVAGSGGIGMKDAQLIALMNQGGIVDPAATLREARTAGLPLAHGCAMLEMESSGGQSVFAKYDRGRNPIRGGPVTKDRYEEYWRYVKAGYNRVGYGPAQLTWWEYQDKAHALGNGRYDYGINLRVGFSVLRAKIREQGGNVQRGFASYNGSGAAASAYGVKAIGKVRKWEQIFAPSSADVPVTGGGTTVVTPVDTQTVPPKPVTAGPYAPDFVKTCLSQTGDQYEMGAKGIRGRFVDPNPREFDCSGLVYWALARNGVRFPMGSWLQFDYCRSRRTLVSVELAVRTQGALLFWHDRPDKGHVAVSLGNGSTIEARGEKYGVNSFSARNRQRKFDHGALVPGLNYGTPIPPDPPNVVPPWPGRYFMQPPVMQDADVRAWQQRMSRRGWRIDADGAYGPESEDVCKRFQEQKNLEVDGVVGPETWRAAWLAPIR
jgi:cell wall-associated NlpC family hydrolase